MASVSLDNVSKRYPDGTLAVEGLSLEIEDGEFVVLIGPSGCGKTSALRMIAGLEEITEGELRIGGRVVNSIEPRQRDIAMVFQNYALYPHMTVSENIGFPLRGKRLGRGETSRRVRETASLLGLTELLDKRPRHLSGGQRQRVAMGRAIIREPQVFLMDEPLSNLDAKLRVHMRTEISRLQEQLGVTTIYVTHDQVEAMTMGGRIAVMRKGVLQQYGTPQQLYDHPVNLFVATFLGTPGMNLFRLRIERTADGVVGVFGAQRLLLGATGVRLEPYAGTDVAVGIRGETLTDAAQGATHPGRIEGEVGFVETLGFDRLVYVRIEAEPVVTSDVLEVAADIDAATASDVERETHAHAVMLVARFDGRSDPRPGERVSLAFDDTAAHYFDLATGQSI
jgi:multiple sugar transport system ATP-binding protein